jgi:hypothetical protein
MRAILLLAGVAAGMSLLYAEEDAKPKADAVSPLVGTWFGKAVQVCGEPISACSKGAIMMTPTVHADGMFTANDTLEFVPVPFGTHATAHGAWESTGPKSMIADYMFLNPTVAATIFPSSTATRLRWSSEVTDDGNTMVGYVNAYSKPVVPTVWESLDKDQFPTVPKEGIDIAVIPDKTVYKHPSECTLYPPSSCPLVFKFRILRVRTR